MTSDGKTTSTVIRLRTFGLLRIEWRRQTEQTTHDESMATTERGQHRAVTLLTALLCQPQRFAPREVLLESIWPEKALSKANPLLDNAAYGLRSLLRHPDLREQDLLEHTSRPQGTGYRLAAYPLIWVDADALCWYVEQAARMERFGDDPLPFWEAAWLLARHGPFLADDLYSPWVTRRRTILDGHTRQCVHRLAALYQERARPHEAELLLRTFLESQPTDEDALRPLLRLLGEQNRYQEAQELFERLTRDLARDGLCPDSRTQEVADYLQAKALVQRPSTTPDSSSLPIQREHRHLKSCGQELPMENIPFEFQYYLLLGRTQIFGSSCANVQSALERELRRLDSMTPNPDGISRRETLRLLAMLPLTLVALFERERKTMIAEELLPQCAASLTACRKLLNSSDMLIVETALPRYLPTLATLAERPSSYQAQAAGLAAQASYIASVLALHHKNITLMEAHRRKALEYAVLTGDINQEGAAVRHLLGAFYHRKRGAEALELYSQVFPRMKEFTPLLQSAILISSAWAFGQRGEASEIDRSIEKAYEIFPTRYEDDPGFLYADFLPVLLGLYEGFARLAIAQPADAWNALASVGGLELGTTTPPERLRLEVINYQAQAALGLGDLELCQACLLEGATGAKKLGSQKRLTEAFTAYQQARVVWPREKRIQELGDLFTPGISPALEL